MALDLNLMVGGEAGQGVQSVGFLLAKAFARGGFHIFADQDYESRIRGGHNFFRVRVRDKEVEALSEVIDILVCLNQETLDLHRGELAKEGVIVCDSEKVKAAGEGVNLLGVPLEKLAVEKAGNKLVSNSVALGASLGLVSYDFDIVSNVLREHFGAGEVAESNIKAAWAGFEHAQGNLGGRLPRLTPVNGAKRMLITGNEAIALGAIASGCKFMAAYPMTPTTSIMEYMASKAKDFDLVVVQPEDEISAINMIIGAAFAGVRAMTATSGGGFCLMVEGLSLAGMTETPIVVVLGQRAGPAIGLPTRTEQGELYFALHAGHGEFPRAVLAPATIGDCFWLTVKAFNLAEKCQTPVILLTDQHLASSYATVERFDLSQVTIDRGQLLSDEEVAKIGEYKRHQITPSGISPRAHPLQGHTLVVTDSDEHNEEGHIIEDAETRTQMVLKRLRKADSLEQDISPPRSYGPKEAETTLVGWGSTYGALAEAADLLQAEGLSVNLLHFNELWPFHAEAIADILDRTKRIYTVENNATGQLARLIRAETGKKVSGEILKFDGRPFSSAHIARELNREVV